MLVSVASPLAVLIMNVILDHLFRAHTLKFLAYVKNSHPIRLLTTTFLIDGMIDLGQQFWRSLNKCLAE